MTALMNKLIQDCRMVFLPLGRNNAKGTNEMLPLCVEWMSLKPAQLTEEPISKNYLSLQLMKNPTAATDHKYAHSFQPVRIDHVDSNQEGQMEPS